MMDDTFSLSMSAAEAKEWHNSRGIPWSGTFNGPFPKMMSQMRPPHEGNLTVHMANEHGRNPDHPDVVEAGREVVHMMYHLYGTFRPGQEHYHKRPAGA